MLRIIIENANELTNQMDIFAIIKDIVIPLLTVVVMCFGVHTVNRLRTKREDATFNFYSRFLVYLELLLSALGTKDGSVLYHLFQEDVHRDEHIAFSISSKEELKHFKKLVDDILGFLKESDGQVGLSKELYEQQKQFMGFLLKECLPLGESYKFANIEEYLPEVHKKIEDYSSLVKNMIAEIEIQQEILLEPLWKKNKKNIEKMRLEHRTNCKKSLIL